MLDGYDLQNYLTKTYPDLKLTVSPTHTEDGCAMMCHTLGCHEFVETMNVKHIKDRVLKMLDNEIGLIQALREKYE